ncbi:MAG: glycosyltransferase family 2 protein [Gammaproteobacteria bacterium]
MTVHRPQVSVIMPTHNRTAYAAEAIRSIQSQSLTDWELLIVASNSDEAHLDVLGHFAASDNRIQLLILEQPSRMNHVGLMRNFALKNAQGSYIALMDDDDLSHSIRLEIQKDFLDKNPHIAACCVQSNFMYMDRSIGTSRGRPVPTRYFPPIPKLYIERRLHVATPSMMSRRQALEEVHGYRSYFAYGAEDSDLSLRMEESFCLAELSDVLYSYRIHPGNMSSNPVCRLFGIQAHIDASWRRAHGYSMIDRGAGYWEVAARLSVLPTRSSRRFLEHSWRYACLLLAAKEADSAWAFWRRSIACVSVLGLRLRYLRAKLQFKLWLRTLFIRCQGRFHKKIDIRLIDQLQA